MTVPIRSAPLPAVPETAVPKTTVPETTVPESAAEPLTANLTLTPDLHVFAPETLDLAAELPEAAVKGLKLRPLENGQFKGNARVRVGKRWLAQRFVLDSAGALQESRCSCGEPHCPHLARVLMGSPFERALAALNAADTAPILAVQEQKSAPQSAVQTHTAPTADETVDEAGAACSPKRRTAQASALAPAARHGRVAGKAKGQAAQDKAVKAAQYGPILQGVVSQTPRRTQSVARKSQAIRYRLNLIPNPEGDSPFVSVGVEQARYTRAGVLLPEQTLELPPAGSPDWRRGWVDTLPVWADTDRELLRGLSDYGDPAILNDQPVQLLRRELLADHLLAALLATGRLHAGADTKPLLPAPARRLRYGWRRRSGGEQQFILRPPAGLKSEQLFALHSRWYLERGARRLGEVVSPLPSEVETALLALPPVLPEQAAATRLLISAQLRELLGEAQAARIPLPQVPDEQEEAAAVPHQPVLTLHETEVLVGRGRWRQTQTLVVAELHHEYAGQRLDHELNHEYKDSEATPYSAAQTLYRRDPQAEAEAARRLSGTSLQRLTKLFAATTQPEHPQLEQLYSVSDPADWHHFLTQVRPKLEAAGFRVDIAASFPYRFAEIDEWYGQAEENAVGGWFDLELGVLVGQERYSLLPLVASLLERQPELLDPAALAALPAERPLLAALPDGRTLALPTGRVRNILSVLVELHLTGRKAGKALRLSVLDAGRVAELDRALNLRWLGRRDILELGQRLQDFGGIASVRAPRGLAAQLRPYQRQGLGWLQFLREYGLGGVLADDMGLGKTVQTLAHILTEKRSGRADLPTLVVAPTSVLGNWRSEAERFTPALRVLMLHGTGRHQHFGSLANYDLVLTSYALLPRDIEQLRGQPFHLVILDEAQNIKNPRSAAARAAGALNARHRLALTGTPLENHLGELWSLFHFLMPGLLGSERQFSALYRTPIEKGGHAARQRALAARLRPFVLRRDKKQVARELPDKTEVVVRLDLEGDQRDLYETVRLNLEGRLRDELAMHGLARASIAVLDALLKLRQAATDPRLVKLKVAEKVQNNAKREWLLSQVPQMLEDGRRILIFSQFAALLGLLETDLQALGIRYSKLTGQTRNRSEVIRQFQEGETEVFLISLKAGGVGLNLTAADTVIHLDPWWNPAAEAQATDRAYRIGQDQPVFVYKLIAAGSVEERILELQARKAGLAQGVLDGGLTSAAQLTQADLDALLAPLSADAAETTEEPKQANPTALLPLPEPAASKPKKASKAAAKKLPSETKRATKVATKPKAEAKARTKAKSRGQRAKD